MEVVRLDRDREPPKLAAYGVALLVVTVATLLCLAMYGRFELSNLIMIYLLGVAIVASRYGWKESALAAVLSVLVFDIAFVPPRGTPAVTDGQYVVTFAVMLSVA